MIELKHYHQHNTHYYTMNPVAYLYAKTTKSTYVDAIGDITNLPSSLYASSSGINGDPVYPTKFTRNPPCNKLALELVGWLAVYYDSAG